MRAIVAVDNQWGIGKKNDLLFHLSADMAYFREKTLHKIVVMGSNTLKSFPGGNPLKNRTNIVLFPGGEKRDDCIVVDSMTELSEVLKGFDTDDVFIIGGAMFYRTMLPYCDTVYVTKVNANGDASVFFENLDKLDGWFCADEGEEKSENGLSFRFTVYKNNKVKEFTL